MAGDPRLPFQVKSLSLRAMRMTRFDGTKRRRITRSRFRWRWLRSPRPPARSWAGAREAQLSSRLASIAKISVGRHQELEAKRGRCDGDCRCSAIHPFVNLLAVVVSTVFMIVYDPVPHSRLGVKRL